MKRGGWLVVCVCIVTVIAARPGAQNTSNGGENPEALLNQARLYAIWIAQSPPTSERSISSPARGARESTARPPSSGKPSSRSPG
jgi:hypothetical protein